MTPLIVLFCSILAGFLLRRRRLTLLPPAVFNIVIWLLLFLLGLSVGSDRNVIDNLSRYGVSALIIGGLATAGSVLAAYLLNKITTRNHHDEG